MKTALSHLVVAFSALALPLSVEPWVLTDGTRLEAEVKLVTPGLVIFTEMAGRDRAVEMNQLSEASRQRLAEVLGLMTAGKEAPVNTPPATAQPKPPRDPSAMDATDLDLIDSQYGKTGTVTGVVKQVITLGSLGHKKLVFEGTDFSVFINKRWLGQSPDWRLDDLAGKVVRITGEITKYEEQLQISPREPAQIVVTK